MSFLKCVAAATIALLTTACLNANDLSPSTAFRRRDCVATSYRAQPGCHVDRVIVCRNDGSCRAVAN
jgi:hypothetical protein